MEGEEVTCCTSCVQTATKRSVLCNHHWQVWLWLYLTVAGPELLTVCCHYQPGGIDYIQRTGCISLHTQGQGGRSSKGKTLFSLPYSGTTYHSLVVRCFVYCVAGFYLAWQCCLWCLMNMGFIVDSSLCDIVFISCSLQPVVVLSGWCDCSLTVCYLCWFEWSSTAHCWSGGGLQQSFRWAII